MTEPSTASGAVLAKVRALMAAFPGFDPSASGFEVPDAPGSETGHAPSGSRQRPAPTATLRLRSGAQQPALA